MRFPIFFFALWLSLGCVQIAGAQPSDPKVVRVDLKYVGPTNVSEQFIRSNIRLKAGDLYKPNLSEDDVHLLYGTGQFYNIRVAVDPQDDGVAVTYIVQTRLRITDVKIEGNTNMTLSKIKKKITVKIGDPLDEQKLFSNVQEIKKLYETQGYPNTGAKYVIDTMDEATGKASVTFQITETRRIRITDVQFLDAKAFPQKQLRKQLKTRRHWLLSWFGHSDRFKEDQFEDDKEALIDFYHNHGYLDFEIREVRFEYDRADRMRILFVIYEGRQYTVGAVKFSGNKGFTDDEIRAGLLAVHNFEHLKSKLGTNNLPMDVGGTFTPEGMNQDLEAIEDFYGSRGYIDVQRGNTLRAIRIPNVDTGTMDVDFQIEGGQKNYVEHIDIRGNIKTKDKVIRRELTISPGQVFNMVNVKISKERIEGLGYFEKVTADPVPTDPPIPGRKDLQFDVQEQDTGKLTMGAGFSSVDSLVGFAEVTQGNFDLFHPPYFTGGGQKLRLFVQLGTKRQDYEVNFTEPWFLDRKLALEVDLYRHQLNFESPNNLFDESRMGGKVGLSRDLYESGQSQLRAGVNYTIEQIGITLNSPYHDDRLVPIPGTFPPIYTIDSANVPNTILNEVGNHIFNRFGGTIAYDTRNSGRLPNHGQRTEFNPEIDIGDSHTYYKLEGTTAWYFPGLFHGHVIEAGGRAGIAHSLNGGDVPFYDRYYLGGLYSLRGFKYRNISPREPGFVGVDEPIGGDSYWFTSIEYSLPLLPEKDTGPSLRFAAFYDAGSVGVGSYTFGGNFNDNWGLGFRLDIPHLGPLRLDYGVPIHHDRFNGNSGQFQFNVGYTRPF